MSLAQALRDGTSESHTIAENNAFIRCFMKGVLEPKSYAKHLESFYFVYAAMEEELENKKDHPIVGKIRFPELYRKGMIEKDLAHFFQSGHSPKATPATETYVKHIREIANTSPELLVAHSYVRYLGDLSGGQILKRVAAKALGIEGTSGLDFYEFPEISSPKDFKDKYRNTLDSLPLSDSEKEKIVQEANEVFKLNGKIFDELEETLVSSIGKAKFEEVLASPARH
ncbi:biliverdin-producing heme oxygenase [Leptospira selangorensis]|uniref:heme oxygenase (biliverdin-producing) n=1 Tax=Leptospira selangorensis TaxID=2484982 RepID=A0A5F2C585_9LEPT|nr:biliverdin-producing heme oxygenase [Leptospira selangorensis]TGM14127.1 biliverdin-producing heme oxygenase [Leptospira selangorensis]TGM26941.1 biliverdin-producing heme oxygenase [Leptospira selangorensis]